MIQTNTYEIDISGVLTTNAINFTEKSIFICCGNIDTNPSGIIYISLTPRSFCEYISNFAKTASKYNISFQIPSTIGHVIDIVNGAYGINTVGKVITIYFGHQINYTFVEDVLDGCKCLKGPNIPGTNKLGNCVYANLAVKLNSKLLPDTTYIPLVNENFGPKYSQTKVLKERPKGNILESYYYTSKDQPKQVIIKEAKYGMWEDIYGRTIVDRLIWEKTLLEKLSSLIKVPKLYDDFWQNQNYYVTMQKLSGITVTDYFKSLSKYSEAWKYWPHQQKINGLRMIRCISEILHELYKNGFIHRDVSTENFIISPSGNVELIDTESIYDFKNSIPSPLFHTGTRGFSPYWTFEKVTPQERDHVYSLGKFVQFLCTLIPPTCFENKKGVDIVALINPIVGDQEILDLIERCLDHPDKTSHLNFIETIDIIINELEEKYSLTNSIENDTHEYNWNELAERSFKSISIVSYKETNLDSANFLQGNGESENIGLSDGLLGAILTQINIIKLNPSKSFLCESEAICKLLSSILQYHDYMVDKCKLTRKDGIYGLLNVCTEAISANLTLDIDMVIRLYEHTVNIPNKVISFNYGVLGLVPVMKSVAVTPQLHKIHAINEKLLNETKNWLSFEFREITEDDGLHEQMYEVYLAIMELSNTDNNHYFDLFVAKIIKILKTQASKLVDEIKLNGINGDGKQLYNRLVKYLKIASAGPKNQFTEIVDLLAPILPNIMIQSNLSRHNGLAFFANSYIEYLKHKDSFDITRRLAHILHTLRISAFDEKWGMAWIKPSKQNTVLGFDSGNSGIVDVIFKVIANQNIMDKLSRLNNLNGIKQTKKLPKP